MTSPIQSAQRAAYRLLPPLLVALSASLAAAQTIREAVRSNSASVQIESDRLKRQYQILGDDSLVLSRYNGGRWKELRNDREVHEFVEQRATSQHAEAYDSSRKLWLRVPHTGGWVTTRNDGELEWRQLYRVFNPEQYHAPGKGLVYWPNASGGWEEVDLRTGKTLNEFGRHSLTNNDYLVLNDPKRRMVVRLPRRPGKMQSLSEDPNGYQTWHDLYEVVRGGSDFDQPEAGAPQQEPGGITLDSVVGKYRRTPAENGWHTGTITRNGDLLQWTNEAGTSWTLTPQLQYQRLATGTDNPYHQAGHREFKLLIEHGRIRGFEFNSEKYLRQ